MEDNYDDTVTAARHHLGCLRRLSLALPLTPPITSSAIARGPSSVLPSTPPVTSAPVATLPMPHDFWYLS